MQVLASNARPSKAGLERLPKPTSVINFGLHHPCLRNLDRLFIKGYCSQQAFSQGSATSSFTSPFVAWEKVLALTPAGVPGAAYLKERWQHAPSISEARGAAERGLGQAASKLDLSDIQAKLEGSVPQVKEAPIMGKTATPDILRADVKMAHQPAEALAKVADVSHEAPVAAPAIPAAVRKVEQVIEAQASKAAQPFKRLFSSPTAAKDDLLASKATHNPAEQAAGLPARDSIYPSAVDMGVLGQLQKYTQQIVGVLVGTLVLTSLVILANYTLMSATQAE